MPFETVDCSSWEDLMAALRRRDGVPLDPAYRGQSSPSWPLVAPSRRDEFKRTMDYRKRGTPAKFRRDASPGGQINYFRKLATGLPGVDVTSLNEIDLAALARHNGLCSDLLDWTSRTWPHFLPLLALSIKRTRAA